MNDPINIRHYSVEEIRRYFDGSMTPAERYAMEKAALGDPFLTEAIEGVELHAQIQPEEKFEAIATDLNERLKQRVNKSSPMHLWWKIAAVLILIVGGVVFTLTIIRHPSSENTTLAKAAPLQDSFISPSSPALTNQDTIINKTELTESAAQQYTATPVAPKNAGKQKAEYQKEQELDLSRNRMADAPSLAKENSLPDSLPGSWYDPTLKNQSHVLEGKAAGANRSGSSPDSGRLEEVVVVGYSAVKRNRNRKAAATSDPLPERSKKIVPQGGWALFDEYINRNKPDTLLRGIQELRFTVDNKGRPSYVIIKQSLSPSADSSAIRLIRLGPDWEIIKGRNRNVRLRIVYD